MRESTYKDALDGGAIFGVQHVPGPLRIRLILLLVATRVLPKKQSITHGRQPGKKTQNRRTYIQRTSDFPEKARLADPVPAEYDQVELEAPLDLLLLLAHQLLFYRVYLLQVLVETHVLTSIAFTGSLRSLRGSDDLPHSHQLASLVSRRHSRCLHVRRRCATLII